MFYLIDKPEGITSFDVIRKLRRLTQRKKMGHIGTLDPFASGVIVVATDKSTKLIPLLEGSKKEYIFEVSLDGVTESLDTDTPILPTPMTGYLPRSKEEIETFLLSQTSQVPPRHSAIHIDGKRAYDLARKGEHFEIQPRDIIVYEAELLSQEVTKLQIRIVISSGGYIRSFAPIIAEFFGVSGGYISSLRRTRICTLYGDIRVEACGSIESSILSPHSYSMIFHTIPVLTAGESLIRDLRDGKSMSNHILENTSYTNGYIFITDTTGSYVSLSEIWDTALEIIRNDVWDL